MNRRMVLAKHRGSVAFWAWVVSIAVHLIALTAFGVVKFSSSEATSRDQLVPTAGISRIKKLIQAARVIPKPKIKRLAESRSATKISRVLPLNQIFDAAKPAPRDWANLAKPSASTNRFSSGSASLLSRTEFFASSTDQRKICYVVDCSGSMKGMFGQVRAELARSIENLLPDQYFYIIFFGQARLFEFGDGYLLRATEQTKTAAYDFIDSIGPAGRTNAIQALERAVQIHDRRGVSPSTIYFLTDGFELTTKDTQKFSQRVAQLLAEFAPKTKINAIGFWPAEDDRKMLEIIAAQSGGELLIIDY